MDLPRYHSIEVVHNWIALSHKPQTNFSNKIDAFRFPQAIKSDILKQIIHHFKSCIDCRWLKNSILFCKLKGEKHFDAYCFAFVVLSSPFPYHRVTNSLRGKNLVLLLTYCIVTAEISIFSSVEWIGSLYLSKAASEETRSNFLSLVAKPWVLSECFVCDRTWTIFETLVEREVGLEQSRATKMPFTVDTLSKKVYRTLS